MWMFCFLFCWLFPLWLISPMIGRLELWPIKKIVFRASIQAVGNAVSSVSLGRGLENHVEPNRLSASLALTVSNTQIQLYEHNVHTCPHTYCHVVAALTPVTCDSDLMFHLTHDILNCRHCDVVPVSYDLLIQIHYCTYCPCKRHMVLTMWDTVSVQRSKLQHHLN